jgi:nitrogen fixation/metabolism regulation signal transduction histidine kinase
LQANRAARAILRSDQLVGRSIQDVFPSFGHIVTALESNPATRASMECRGRKRDGEMFVAHVMFSQLHSEDTVALIFSDAEEWTGGQGGEERGAHSLTQLAAVFDLHEIRNLAWAASATCGELAKEEAWARHPMFAALQQSVRALMAVCSHEMRPVETSSIIELRRFFDDLRELVSPLLQDSAIDLRLPESGAPVFVRGDANLFYQVFLNLVRNSILAVSGASDRSIHVGLEFQGNLRVIRYSDSGPGVADDAILFQVLTKGPDYHSVGLYAARAIIRTMGGELRYERGAHGCCFVIELFAADEDVVQRSSLTQV